jgi:hypothetical protein
MPPPPSLHPDPSLSSGVRLLAGDGSLEGADGMVGPARDVSDPHEGGREGGRGRAHSGVATMPVLVWTSIGLIPQGVGHYWGGAPRSGAMQGKVIALQE